MPEYATLLAVGGAGLVAGALVAYILIKKSVVSELNKKRGDGEAILRRAREEADSILRKAEIDAKESVIKRKADFERETETQRKELQRLEERLVKRQENIERKNDLINSKEIEISRKEKTLSKREYALKEKEKEKEMLIAKQQETLEKIAAMTQTQARQQVMSSVVDEAKRLAAKEIKQIEDATKEEAEKKARDIIATAVQRYGSEVVQERSVKVVSLPSDEMKGRIIGREGRNIRALEASTGVEFIVDDTPESVTISGFDPIRREVARVALEKLVSDGRIHPNRIEEVVSKSNEEVQKNVKEAGERALMELGIGRMHPELVKLIGQLKYRYSYAQNVLQHSLETAFLAGIMAGELHLSVRQARRAGLLHDIGKAVSHQVEGSHAVVGAQLARKFGEAPEIVHAIEAHHEDVSPQSALAFLISAADAISGARPGARREVLETYLKRVEDLEKICTSFSGVEKSFAVQAGREVRVLVESQRVTDEGAAVLAKDIAQKVEKELSYPGQIKVTVIRETRAVEYAK
jgi:ribonuclease Y